MKRELIFTFMIILLLPVLLFTGCSTAPGGGGTTPGGGGGSAPGSGGTIVEPGAQLESAQVMDEMLNGFDYTTYPVTLTNGLQSDVALIECRGSSGKSDITVSRELSPILAAGDNTVFNLPTGSYQFHLYSGPGRQGHLLSFSLTVGQSAVSKRLTQADGGTVTPLPEVSGQWAVTLSNSNGLKIDCFSYSKKGSNLVTSVYSPIGTGENATLYLEDGSYTLVTHDSSAGKPSAVMQFSVEGADKAVAVENSIKRPGTGVHTITFTNKTKETIDGVVCKESAAADAPSFMVKLAGPVVDGGTFTLNLDKGSYDLSFFNEQVGGIRSNVTYYPETLVDGAAGITLVKRSSSYYTVTVQKSLPETVTYVVAVPEWEESAPITLIPKVSGDTTGFKLPAGNYFIALLGGTLSERRVIASYFGVQVDRNVTVKDGYRRADGRRLRTLFISKWYNEKFGTLNIDKVEISPAGSELWGAIPELDEFYNNIVENYAILTSSFTGRGSFDLRARITGTNNYLYKRESRVEGQEEYNYAIRGGIGIENYFYLHMSQGNSAAWKIIYDEFKAGDPQHSAQRYEYARDYEPSHLQLVEGYSYDIKIFKKPASGESGVGNLIGELKNVQITKEERRTVDDYLVKEVKAYGTGYITVIFANSTGRQLESMIYKESGFGVKPDQEVRFNPPIEPGERVIYNFPYSVSESDNLTFYTISNGGTKEQVSAIRITHSLYGDFQSVELQFVP